MITRTLMKRIVPSLAAFLLVFSALSLGAAEQQYFLGDARAIFAKIPPPPADDSPAGMADLETLLQVQRDRTPEQEARAKRIAAHSSMQMGAVVFGPEFSKKTAPRTEALLKRLSDARRKAVGSGKDLWNRPRPFVRSADVEICVKRPSSTSYPSGHSATGAFWGAIYSAAFPEYEELFAGEVRETMWCRVLGGVHYPSDTTAGRMLGTMVAEEMLKTPATQAAVKEIRAECLAFLKARPEVKKRADKLAEEARAKARK